MSGDVNEVAAVLADHALVIYTGTGLVHCRCDSDARTPLTTRKKHRTHVAAALAPLIDARVEAAKAEAWDEGVAWALSQYWHREWDEDGKVTSASAFGKPGSMGNPYRADRRAER